MYTTTTGTTSTNTGTTMTNYKEDFFHGANNNRKDQYSNYRGGPMGGRPYPTGPYGNSYNKNPSYNKYPHGPYEKFPHFNKYRTTTAMTSDRVYTTTTTKKRTKKTTTTTTTTVKR